MTLPPTPKTDLTSGVATRPVDAQPTGEAGTAHGDGSPEAVSVPRPQRRWQLGSLSLSITLTFVMAGILFLIGGALHAGFLRWTPLSSVLVLASFVGFVGAGQTLAILTGGVDLSVPWVITAGGVMVASLAAGSSARAGWAVPATLAMGVGVGVINGLGITVFAVPPLVMTLGMNGIVEGLVLWLTNGFTSSSAKTGSPHVITQAAQGKLPGGIPVDLVIWAGVGVLMWLLLSRLVIGRWIYAIGNNRLAAYLAGGQTRRVLVAVYALSGGFAALTGIMLVGYSGQATLSVGDPYLFSSITAVVIGGASILGGRGNYLGTIGGAIFVVMLTTVLELANIAVAAQDIVYGVIILIALAVYAQRDESVR